VGIFDKKEKADFSHVQSGSSTNAPIHPPVTPTPPSAAARTYTVQSGDTLSAIAKREYGNAGDWKRIFEANRDQIKDPDMIHPGQQLKIPPAGGVS
jgi:nucleoid-associated protein YgaU